jgi:hypothetical protein
MITDKDTILVILEKLNRSLVGRPGDGVASRHGSKPRRGIIPDTFILTMVIERGTRRKKRAVLAGIINGVYGLGQRYAEQTS